MNIIIELRKLIDKIKAKLHVHSFNKPIKSQYWTFCQRQIIFQCRCGERQQRKVYRAFGDAFPIETGVLTSNKEMEDCLNHKLTPDGYKLSTSLYLTPQTKSYYKHGS